MKRRWPNLSFPTIFPIIKVGFKTKSLHVYKLNSLFTIGPPRDVNQAKEFFKKRFINLNDNPKKEVYVHFTVATDTKLLAHVMDSVSDSILHENLQTLLL